MKASIKKWLKSKGVYNRVRYSRVFRVYEIIFKRQLLQQEKKERTLYKSFLPPCKLIFDIGAYDGHKAAAFLSVSEQIVCCEPDIYSFNILQKRFKKQLGKRIFIQNNAVSASIAEELYYRHHDGSAFNTLNPRWKNILEKDGKSRWNEDIVFFTTAISVSTITLDALIDKYGCPDFIKIDAEGSESKILDGLSKRVQFLSFECLLPDFKDELVKCLEKIQHLDNHPLFNIIYEEQLLLSAFTDSAGLSDWINKTTITCFEIVVKMSV